jgi:hypothetical protein
VGEQRADFLKECMTDPALNPGAKMGMDMFNLRYCAVCSYRPCTRSPSSEMAFDMRVANWKSVLFDRVPRAESGDPAYDSIRSKTFPSREAPIEVFTPSPADTTSPVRGRFQLQMLEEEPVRDQEAEPAAPSPAPPPAQPQGPPQAYENTPFVQGTVLPGQRAVQSPAAQAPSPAPGVVQPGATFTFGGDDE